MSSRHVSPVRAIEISVIWTEGENEFQVIRTTYGFDIGAFQRQFAPAGEPFLPPGAGASVR